MSIKRLPLFTIWLLLLAQAGLGAQSALKDTPQRKPSQSHNLAASFDLQSYTLELERWSRSAGHLREHPEKAAALRGQLPDAWSVTVQDDHFEVSTRPLGAALDGIIRDPRTAAKAAQEVSARAESLLAEARAMSGPAVRDYGGTRAKLDDILKRREFRFVRRTDESETIWDRLLDEAWEWIDRILSRASGHPRAANYLRWGIVVALGMICLAWLVYSLAHIPYSHLPAPAAEVGARRTRDWVQQARAAAERAEYREAIRIIYGAAVLRLGEAGVWQVDPSRTHREYVRLLPADSALRPHLMAIAGCFERVWYGEAPASAGDFEGALAELESLP